MPPCPTALWERPAPRSRRSAWAAWACRTSTDRRTDAESIATIHAALDAGITLLDTGDFYGMGHNELLIARGAARAAPRRRRLSVKFGALREPDRRLGRLRARPGGGEELSRLHAAPARHRLHRHLPAGAGRSRGAHRGYDRRHRRDGAGRPCAPHRPVRGRRRDDAPRRTPCIRSATCRSSIR